MNYARHVGNGGRNKGTGVLVFFTSELPARIKHEVHEWAFWSVPAPFKPEEFQGRLIGECPIAREIRLGIS